jgi:hypothetical protein
MKVEFLSRLRTEDIDDERAALTDPLIAVVDGETITIPKGTETDFASVPRIPLAYLLAGGTARRAAALHDYLYAQQRDREWADEVFLAAMEADGVPWWRRQIMYAAVRAFGEGPYREKVA